MRKPVRLLAAAVVLAAVPVLAAPALVSSALAGPFGLSAEQLAALAPQLDLLRSCPPEDEWRGLAGTGGDCPGAPLASLDQDAD